jgi:hypothetical protein
VLEFPVDAPIVLEFPGLFIVSPLYV